MKKRTPDLALLPGDTRASIAVDGWAVDYVRVDAHGMALADPFCYRDERTIKAERALHRKIGAERLRELTGVQLIRINTLYQLYADHLQGLPEGRQWLNLPEYILSRWGGARVAEYTNATHTGMVKLHERQWCREIFRAAHLDLSRPLRYSHRCAMVTRRQPPCFYQL